MAAGARGVGFLVGALGRHFVLRLLHRHRPVAHVVAQFVGREVAAGEPGAGFEANDLDARLRKRQHRDAARRAEANDDDVGGFESGSHHSTPWWPALAGLLATALLNMALS